MPLEAVGLEESSAPVAESMPVEEVRPVRKGMVRGVYHRNVRGFGFVDLPDGSSAFVQPRLASPLWDRDIVDVATSTSADGRMNASRVELVERPRREVFGTVGVGESGMVLHVDPFVAEATLPLPVDVVVLPDNEVRCRLDGDDVVVVRVHVSPDDPEALRERVVVRHQIREDFDRDVEKEAKGVAQRAGRSHRLEGRRDLRDLHTITIDAPSSGDLDDALSVLPADAKGGVRVFVHIADVAEHVEPGSVLDDLAREAGTSVYLPGWTRPMFPRSLSEGALSLLPEVERDVLTVEMRLDTEGSVTAVDVFEARIRSDERLSYDAAAVVLGGGETPDASSASIETLRWLRTAGARLGLQRARRGGVEARRVEPELVVTVQDGVLAQYRPEPQNPANLLVERLMVAANEAIASWLRSRGVTPLLRVHDCPGAGAVAEMAAFAESLGFFPGFSPDLSPLALAALEQQVSQAPDRAGALWEIVVKHLGRARYTPVDAGHFGLASPAYLHFTSPLRRYADLVVHRLVKSYLRGERSPESYPSFEDLSVLGRHLDDRSRSAAQAESQMRKLLWLLALETSEEESLSGRISGFGKNFLRVTLDSSLVVGEVSFRDLTGGPWKVDDLQHSAAGKKSTYRLGESIQVRVVGIDMEAGILDLVDVERERKAR